MLTPSEQEGVISGVEPVRGEGMDRARDDPRRIRRKPGASLLGEEKMIESISRCGLAAVFAVVLNVGVAGASDVLLLVLLRKSY